VLYSYSSEFTLNLLGTHSAVISSKVKLVEEQKLNGIPIKVYPLGHSKIIGMPGG